MPYKNKEIGKQKKKEYYQKNKKLISLKRKEKRLLLITEEFKKKEREQSKKRYLDNKNKGINKHKKYLQSLSEEELKNFKINKNEKAKEYYQKNKDKFKERSKIANAKRKFTKYGLTEEDYLKIWEEQNYVCAICKLSDNTKHLKSLPLLIDHDHSTQIIRGLLCTQCNILLGMSKDDINILKNAIFYLTK